MTEPGRMPLSGLDTPVLLVDRDALDRNIQRMKKIAGDAGIAYRPHAKTHKSPIIGDMQMAAGAVGLCCAKLGEAEVFAAAGAPDILITSEVIGPTKLIRLLNLAQQTRLGVVVDSEINIQNLAGTAQTAGVRLDVLIEVDVGQGRCGVPPGPEAARLAGLISDQRWLRFRGLQGYQGSIQMTQDLATRESQVRDAMDRLQETAGLVRDAGFDIEVLTGGGSGSSIFDVKNGVYNELQPGSYVFMDSRYIAIDWAGGEKTPFEPALSVLATVISRPDRHRAIVDSGYKTLSSDGGMPVAVDEPAAAFTFAGDEHGQLKFDGTCPLEIGDQVRLIPSHCDTTVNLHDSYIVTSGDAVVDVWEIAARGRIQ